MSAYELLISDWISAVCSSDLLADIDVAEARPDPLVEQHRLYRRPAPRERPCQTSGVEGVRERFGAERHEGGKPGQRIAGDEIDRPEAARIMEEEPVAARGLQKQMIVLARLAALGAPAARHAEVKDNMVVAVGRDDAIFGAGRQRRDRGAGQPRPGIGRAPGGERGGPEGV